MDGEGLIGWCGDFAVGGCLVALPAVFVDVKVLVKWHGCSWVWTG